MKRYVYVRATVNSWSIIDTLKAPAPCEVIAFVPDPNPPDPTDLTAPNANAARICEVMNRDHEMAVAMGAPPYQGPTQ